MRNGLMDIRITFAFAFAFSCAAVTASGCNPFGGKGCTLVGCSDQFSATIRSADGSFPSGAHRIELLVDSTSLTCSFTATADGQAQPSCGSGMRVTVWPETTCTDTTTNGSVSHQCDPIPGKFYETITLEGTPGQVHAWQYVDDVAILDAATAPTYHANAPNGTECGPICQQASVSWTFMP
ncbi:MAG TPA: hypothetical protein VN903_34890 [Polyangia bacterium]|nr:hypothetical protein [Polyangia bacterium]